MSSRESLPPPSPSCVSSSRTLPETSLSHPTTSSDEVLTTPPVHGTISAPCIPTDTRSSLIFDSESADYEGESEGEDGYEAADEADVMSINVVCSSRTAALASCVVIGIEQVPPGTLLLKCEPFAFVLTNNHRLNHCDYCFSEFGDGNPDYGLCAGCRYVRYCDNDNCHDLGWQVGHKYECKSIGNLRDNPVINSARLMLRVIVKLKQAPPESAGPGDWIRPDTYRSFYEMESHFEEFCARKELVEHIMAVRKAVLELAARSPEISIPYQNDFIETYGKVFINVFGIHDEDFITLGAGLYIGASIFNHSCCPLAIATFESKTLSVRNLAELPPGFPLGSVTISYIDIIKPTNQRIAELKANYFFGCVCDRCKLEMDDLDMVGVACQICRQQIDIYSSTECDECEESPTPEYKRKIKKITDAAKRLLRIQAGGTRPSGDAVEKTLRILMNKGFSPTHWLITNLCLAAVDISIDSERWVRAYVYAKLALPGLRRFLNSNHAVLGFHFLKLGRLAWYMGYCAEAGELTKDAVNTLGISYGKESSLFKTVVLGYAADIITPKDTPRGMSSEITETDLDSEQRLDTEVDNTDTDTD